MICMRQAYLHAEATRVQRAFAMTTEFCDMASMTSAVSCTSSHKFKGVCKANKLLLLAQQLRLSWMPGCCLLLAKHSGTHRA